MTSALLSALPMLSTPTRLGNWTRVAWRRLSWRHVVLAVALSLIWNAIGPNGGAYFFPLDRVSDLLLNFLTSRWFHREFFLIFLALVADAAFDDGVPAWQAYGAAALAFAIVSPEIDQLISHYLLGFGKTLSAATLSLFWAVTFISQGGIGMAVYAYWRTSQQSIRRAHEIDAERLRTRQRLEESQLMAMQARVEPQLLFDGLAKVHALHAIHPYLADQLLGDLIVLLRALLPHEQDAPMHVWQELALVNAWLAVQRKTAMPWVEMETRTTMEAGYLRIPPMLVLPMLRAVLANAAPPLSCILDASLHGELLHIRLTSSRTISPAESELETLRARLRSLRDDSASLVVSSTPPAWTLVLPAEAETEAP